MTLGNKIVLTAVGSVIVTAAAGLVIQRSVIRRQGIEMIRGTLRATILGAENTRQSVSAMRNNRVFDDLVLKAEAGKASDYKQTRMYATVPVVAAWNAIRDVAAKEGYEFRVAADHPRNPDNALKGSEAEWLKTFEAGRDEFFLEETASNTVVYARPIVLSADCMMCHGDPSGSPTHDGKDLLGFKMESWRAGDRHGMFLLRAPLAPVDAQVAAGMKQAAMWLLPLSLFVGGGVYWFMTGISKRLSVVVESLSQGAAQVTSAVQQIAISSQSLATGASQQAASLEETSASSEEIASMTRRNMDHAVQAAHEVSTVDGQVAEANAALGDMEASMTDIRASSDKISKIIRVIDDIAFQTNILALNAAVEAARAGEAGAGFAVVAEEVRNLAQRSAQAAHDTAPLIEESIAHTETGVGKLARVSATIHAITESSRAVQRIVGQVEAGSKEQSRGIEQVSQAVAEMQQLTQTAAASTEEAAAAAEELEAQAQAMDEVARELQAVVRN